MNKESLQIPVEQRKEKISEAEEKTFDLLVKEHSVTAINMNKFAKIPRYAERLERDKASVEKKKTTIKKEGTEPTKKARILEALLAEQIELSSWFGDKTYTIVPTEYDDLFHGIDLALEIHDEENTDETLGESRGIEYLALGIDVTSSPLKIHEKLRRIKDHIVNGTLTMMEYFHSETYNPDFYGVMTNIPQVVIGAEGRTIKELSELWMTAYGLPKLRKRLSGAPLSPEAEQSQRRAVKEAKDKLGRHRIQFLLLEQIKIQLTVFRKFAVKSNQTEAAQKISSLLELVDSVLQEKGIPEKEDVFRNSEDHVFQSLSEALNDFENL